MYTLDPLTDPRWPELLERHPGASVFHSRGWLEALRRAYAYEPIAYTTSPPATRLANGVVFCRVRSWLTGRRLVSLPFSDHCEPLVDGDEDLHRLLDAVLHDVNQERWTYVELRPLHRRVGGRASFENTSRFFAHRIDLRPSIEELFDRLHKNCVQRKIRRAQREALTYEVGSSDALLRTFYRMLVLTCRRRQLPPQPLEWFRRLIETMGDCLKIHVAAKDGRPAASILTLSFKRTLVYKYGCSDPELARLGATPFLLWKAIQAARRDGLHEFDLGRSDVDAPGLVAFKERWGATRSVLDYQRCGRAPGRNVTAPGAIRLAKGVFASMPDTVLIAAGQMLYRHVG